MLKYHRIFLETYGALPHPCAECGKPVRDFKQYQGVVHHVDEDRNNNDPSNLVPMHFGCHMRHHKLGKTPAPLSDEAKQRISHAMSTRTVSSETRAKLRAAKKGYTPTEETRAKMRAAHVTRDPKTKLANLMCECECKKICNVGGMTSHCRATGHTSWRIDA